MSHQEQLERLQPLRDGGLQQEASQRLIADVNTSMRDARLPAGPADYSRAIDQLRGQGILPNLILNEFGRLDENRDNRVSERELSRVIGMRNVPFLTGVAARGLRGMLREMGGQEDPRTGEYSVERNRFEAFVRAGQQRQAPEAAAPAQPGRPGEQRAAETRPGARPETPQRQERPAPHANPEAQRQIDILQAGQGTPRERLAAVTALARMGVNNITLVDSNGDHINCRIQVGRVGQGSDRNYVHLWARGANGREQIMLRGVEQNGQYSEQTRNDRTAAGYAGTNWTRTRPTSVLTGTRS